MFLEIITPEKQLFSGEVKLVNLPGSKGAFEILNNHAPIVSTLGNGSIKVIDMNGQASSFEIKDGVIEAKANKIIVLAESV